MRGGVIESLVAKRRIQKYAESALCGIGVASMVFAFLPKEVLIQIGGSALGYVLGFVAWFISAGALKINKSSIARFLSKAYPEFENSAELLVKGQSSLNIIERIQVGKIESVLSTSKVRLPANWTTPAIVFLLGASLVLFTQFLDFNPRTETTALAASSIENDRIVPADVSIISTEISIKSPEYSKILRRTQNSLKIEGLQGSLVNWSIEFSDPKIEANLIFSDGSSLAMKGNDVKKAGLYLNSNSFYQIEYKLDSLVKTTDLYTMISIKDQGTVIELPGRDAFQEFEFGTITQTEIVAHLSDDFGLKNASIVATVAKGSGEGVKFREEVFEFDQGIERGVRSQVLERTLSFDSLGLEPGDELYFYVKATDNMAPVANESRSETYFVALADTAIVEFSMVGNLGVDLMPEYFRSQRQLIIETEQLIKDKPKITKHDFNFKSNELGYDQKVLRLKYGQFMGEEFVSDSGDGAGSGGSGENVVGDEEDPLAAFSHAHDSENDHNILEVKDASDFEHNHDSEEENTYFSMSVRAKLKEAMTQMWDAELYLRLFEPHKSLPYQYSALELIQEIKNNARIYVQRMGFDPPPLKPVESRLTGKALDEVVSSRARQYKSDLEAFKNLRSLLISINGHFRSSEIITAQDWQNAGNELAAIAIAEPGKYFDELNLIQLFRDNKVTDFDNDLVRLYNSLIQVIPQNSNEISKANTLSIWNKALAKQIGEEN